MAEVLPEIETGARIKVVGVGGGGTSGVERMIKAGLKGVEFVVVNTDAQALHHSAAPTKVHIGKSTTRGLGAGADPSVGRKAAEESQEEIFEMLKGSDMVFVTAGQGGGTGTGASPLVAAAARESGALVVGIVTRPFTFEGDRRRQQADDGIAELKENVDTLITIPNDRLLQMIDRRTSLLEAFHVVDDVLQQGVQGISDLITVHGLINLDFADVKAIMADAGSALMGIGRASGDNRAVEAARKAIESPLLEVSIEGAQGVLFNITGGRNMTMHEIDEAAKTITDAVDPGANIIFGAVLDESLDDDLKITVVATGFDGFKHPAVKQKSRQEEPMPLFSRTSVTAAEKPFINEPTAFREDEEDMMAADQPAESILHRRRSPLASIEPEPLELDDSFFTEDGEEDKPKKTESKSTHRPTKAEPAKETDPEDFEIPAFIRRKVD